MGSVAGAAVVALMCASTPLTAQLGPTGGRLSAQPCTEAPIFMLLTYPKAPDKRTAERSITDLRQQMTAEFPRKELCLVDKSAADDMLRLSGWKADSTLHVRDAVELAKQMRADEVLEFSVEPAGRGFLFRGRVVLARDAWFRDSVPTPEPGENMSQAAKFFVANVRKVRAQLEHERRCYMLGREGKHAEAEVAARAGVAAYPNAAISRLCLASVLFQQKKPAAEVLAETEKILGRDDSNALALRLAIDAYFVQTDTNNYARVASKFVTIDPGNPAMETIVANLAAWRKTDVALPLLATVLKENPEDHALLRLEFKLLYNTDRIKEVLSKGEALARIDTAAVDTLFVFQLTSAYARDSQPQRVADWLARGVSRFPTNVTMVQRLAQQLKALGKTQEAIDVYKRVLVLNPRTPEVRLRVANYFNELGQQDSSMVWLREAHRAGDDKAQISGVALSFANAALRAIQANKAPADTTLRGAHASKALADYQNMLSIAAFADSVESSPNTMFFWGMAEYGIGTSAYTLLREQATPSCDLARMAFAAIQGAQQHIFAGARAQPAAAGQILPTLPDLQNFLEEQVKNICKTT